MPIEQPAWKCATGFVLTAETWLGPERTRSGEEAVLTIGVSPHERMAVIRRIRHGTLIRPARMASGRRARRDLFSAAALGTEHRDGRGSCHVGGRVCRGWRATGASVAIRTSSAMRNFWILVIAAHQIEQIVPALASQR
jgi:hypothetical protein